MLKRLFVVLSVLCVLLTLAACTGSGKAESGNTVSGKALTREAAMQPNGSIKNIIVMIPDGMGYDGVTLAR